jgi:hypothetical protein
MEDAQMKLIEDAYGRPLPDDLQFESPVWNQVADVFRSRGYNAEAAVLSTDAIMREIDVLARAGY